MNTPFRFARNESSVRRLAAGCALALTLGLLAALGNVADRQYDDVLMSQADQAPTQVVVVVGKRMPRG